MNCAIRVRDLRFSYGVRTVLNGVSFDIRENALTFILGRNGSGKSTLLRIVAGILPHRHGRVYINVGGVSSDCAGNRSKQIAFLGQHHQPVFPFTVRDVVVTGRAGHVGFFPRKNDFAAADGAIASVGIGRLAARPYTELSGGERQLVLIARCLAKEPSILLLDEPLSHLDFTNQAAFMRLLKRLVRQGITVAAVIHDPNWAFLYGDDILFVHNGDVLRDETHTPWEHPLVETLYGPDIIKVPYAGKMMLHPAMEAT